jgi:hypothetical protein
MNTLAYISNIPNTNIKYLTIIDENDGWKFIADDDKETKYNKG